MTRNLIQNGGLSCAISLARLINGRILIDNVWISILINVYYFQKQGVKSC